MGILDRAPWSLLVLASLTLGLAPFNPPHILEKARMLADGTLTRPIDWFDLLIHSAPWAALSIKAVLWFRSG